MYSNGMASNLKLIYQSITEEGALLALKKFEDK